MHGRTHDDISQLRVPSVALTDPWILSTAPQLELEHPEPDDTHRTRAQQRQEVSMVLAYLARQWRRWRWRMELYATPLELRYSVRVLSQIRRYPVFSLLALFLRYPRHFACELPPPPRVIMAYEPETYMDEKHPDVYELRLVPVWKWRDTLQRSFYRLYEAFCAYDEVLVGYETEYLWKGQPGWNPEDLRDPREDGCEDAEQLAVMASLADAVVASFNWRLSLGLRRDAPPDDGDGYAPVAGPSWAEHAPVLQERLLLHVYDDPDDKSSSPDFDKRNIQASTAAMRTV